MIYDSFVVDDIRRREREKALSREYAHGELEGEIRKYTRRTYSCIATASISLVLTIGGPIHFISTDCPAQGLLSGVLGCTLTGISLGIGKVSAIKADAFYLAKENLEKKSKR